MLFQVRAFREEVAMSQSFNRLTVLRMASLTGRCGRSATTNNRKMNLVAILMILAATLISSVKVFAVPSSYSLLDARDRGTFTMGASKGDVNRIFDETVKKDVLKFNYSAPQGTAVGVWTKNFPSELGAGTVNAVKINVKVPNPKQLRQISMTLEIKGTRVTQSIPLSLKSGWNTFRELIEWNKIGDLKEVVFVVSPMGGSEPAVGKLYLALDFAKVTSLPKSGTATKVPSSYSLLDARDRGTFTMGASKGDVNRTFDETVKKDVLKFNYSAPQGTAVGVWTKNFPSELGAGTVNAVKINVKVPNPKQLRQISMTLEIKGTRVTQSIPLSLKSGWNTFRELIEWNKIGDLKEVVFVVSPMGGSEPAVGRLYLALDFVKVTSLPKSITATKVPSSQKSNAPVGGKVGLVFVTAFLLSLLTALFRKMFRQLPSGFGNYIYLKDKTTLEVSTLSIIKRDFLYGVSAVLIAGVSLGIYYLGTTSFSDIGGDTLSSFRAGLGVLALGLVGAVIAELLKFGLTGKHLTSVEVFQNIFLTGLLAATSSNQVLWQAPTTWAEVLMKSNLTAALACLIYHISNACSLVSSGKHLRAVSGALIVGTPYLFGWLLMLENVNLLQTLSSSITGGTLAAWPSILEGIGRLTVVFGFNEAVMNGISLVTKGRILKSPKTHRFILFISLGVIVSPTIADLGSTSAVALLSPAIKSIVAVLTTMFSQAGLWGEVYLITGLILDGTHGTAPSWGTIFNHVNTGTRKGMAYSGTFMAILYGLNMLLNARGSQIVMTASPLVVGILSGALLFPLIKTIIESFDGSQVFFERVRYSYQDATLYARGAVAGFGLAYAMTHGLFQQAMPDRIVFGLAIGLLASVGVSVVRDITYALGDRGQVQSWRLYFIDALLGGFVGSAAAFYMDSSQVPVVIEKFKLYTSAGLSPKDYTVYPLISKWGRIDLGSFAGGVKLLFNEALAGVICWSIAAWLFAINRVFMEAYFQKDNAPIKHFFSKVGFIDLIKHMIQVLRWGLWMSPIINTFLRMMAEATWYNQDGAIHTLVAIYKNVTMSSADFQTWSLQVFVSLLACDIIRILIWIDHMGLRVATLVNLSFIGMNKLDERIARFIGPAAAQRYIPEGVKRFTTWAPLLIPFYIPRGAAWDYAWSKSETIQKAAGGGGALSVLQSLPLSQVLFFIGWSILVCTVISFIVRTFMRRSAQKIERVFELSNREYKVVLKENGEGYSHVVDKGYDISRRSYDTIDPCGRALYLVDTSQGTESATRSWPVLGNFPKKKFEASCIEGGNTFLKVTNTANDIRTTINVSLPDHDTPVELWTVTVENLTAPSLEKNNEGAVPSNLQAKQSPQRHIFEHPKELSECSEAVSGVGLREGTDKSRQIKVVPYLEWVLDRPDADRGHTQYARLYPEMEYVSGANAVLAWNKHTKSMGILASDISPEGFLTSRMDFIGRARSIWAPRVLETLNFLKARDTSAYPTFDPIGSLVAGVTIEPKNSKTVRFMIGYAKDKETALELINKHLKPQVSKDVIASVAKQSHFLRSNDETSGAVPEAMRSGIATSRSSSELAMTGSLDRSFEKKSPLIGHGEILPGTPHLYSEYIDNGNKLLVRTPYTPRPYDHAMSNALGHCIMVTNRGLHTTSNGNSQQNRLTPDWSDTVTKEVPAEAIYLYDQDRNEWYCPTLHPLNNHKAKHESEFGVDGTAIFRMVHKTISTDLTVFVPPDEPVGIYLLTIRNNDDHPRRMRIAPYFQIVLAGQPEWSGPLKVQHDKTLNTLFFENPRNTFRSGPAFASLSIPSECVETKRGRFFGTSCGVTHPFMVEKGEPDITQTNDDRPIASFLGTIEIPALGEKTIAIILGQTDNRKQAVALIQKYKNIEAARTSLDETRKWWLSLMRTVGFKTNHPEFDQFQNWLKYQAIAERIWARRGFYQTSGAFGFRDQLQDTVNLVWVDPALARKQIILHASQQFIEGDVCHWFFTLSDGRTAFANRSHASDNLLWLAWGVAEYVKATGDKSILNEMTSYVMSENPFQPLPKNKHGWGDIYHRSTQADTVYRHCLKSIDLVLEKRMGAHGIPLIGTGDWNDGLDEIGSEGRGESIWLGFFLYYILKNMLNIIERKEGKERKEHYLKKMQALETALEKTWRDDRYLRAIHDDGTEIGVKDSGIWEIDALTAAWAVMSGINPERGRTVFHTALQVLEKENVILLGYPPLREDTKPYLGRSSKYPEGVRENGMYCHGVQWLIGAARILSEHFERQGDRAKANEYRATAYRLWRKIAPVSHVTPQEIEVYGGQPNKQAADMLTTFDQGRMIWHGYTGAAGWMLLQAFEGVVGASLINNEIVLPSDLNEPRGELKVNRVYRDLTSSPLKPK